MPIPLITPSQHSPAQSRSHLVVIVHDDRAIVNLMEKLFEKSGLTQSGLAERMGVTRQTVNQYFAYRRRNPSIKWFQRFAEACGGRLVLEMPGDKL